MMVNPKFRELFMCKLTTATTCYSAARDVSEEPWTAHLATENHTLAINLVTPNGQGSGEIQRGDVTDNPSFVERPIPIPFGVPRRRAKQLICVGYCQREGWEAIILLDTSRSHESTSHQGHYSHGDERANAMIDARSHRRGVSLGNASVASTDGTASLSSTTSAASVAPVVASTENRGSTTATTAALGGVVKLLANLEEEEGGGGNHLDDDEVQVRPIARLILQHVESQRQFTKGLDFRPLSPCITILTTDGVVGVWVGSSDDSNLRLFKTDRSTTVLVEVTLQSTSNYAGENATTFQTPIMAVSCLSKPTEDSTVTVDEEEKAGGDSKGIVAVACQDGTVRIIECERLEGSTELRCCTQFTVVVDGPIVCIHLVHKKDTGQLEAVFGSLCGYVARITKKPQQPWEGPYMVAEGFEFQSMEDSVLAVHAWDEKVALGTYSGRCLLFGTDGDNEDNLGLPFWDCQLPDSIHGICHIPAVSSTCLLVTTRRSVHIFEEIPKDYHPELAKRKLELILLRQQQKNQMNKAMLPTEGNPNEVEETKVDSGSTSASLSASTNNAKPMPVPEPVILTDPVLGSSEG